jgi:hypothetical protein
MGNDFTKIPRPFYPPLSSHKREIRLLHLQLGDETLEFQCRLSVVSINSNPLYEALSYAWGNPNNASSIAVDGHDVLIPSNLEQALRKLRLNDSERVLWADAICTYPDRSRIKHRRNLRCLFPELEEPDRDLFQSTESTYSILVARNTFTRNDPTNPFLFSNMSIQGLKLSND